MKRILLCGGVFAAFCMPVTMAWSCGSTDRPALSLLYRTDTSRPLSVFVKSDYQGDGIDGYHWRHVAGLDWRPSTG